MKEKSCNTCAHKSAETVDSDGVTRMVDCEINELQMYSPWVDECKHWEKRDED
ncbi:MAG: hypothetical protein IKE22_13850 [Atopobiaceae bacterium]|nr:hypothetical protein [Atopobiaceae bacterium]